MPRHLPIQQTDITRAIRAALEGGLKLGEFEVRADGESVRIITYANRLIGPPDDDPNPWHSIDFNG